MNLLTFLSTLGLVITGFFDARYLTLVHYKKIILVCHQIPLFVDCGKVLQSSYSTMFGIPLAVLGLINYSVLIIIIILAFISQKRFFQYWLIIQTKIGFIASLYFMFLQLFIIKSLCLYCTTSAVISTILFIIVIFSFKLALLSLIGIIYKLIVKRILFLFDPEFIHESMTGFGETLGKSRLITKFLSQYLITHHQSLKQSLAGINFNNPVGLAAGFDYEAKLTQISNAIGFGFQTVGTITNLPYEGNPYPRLGRLPRSQSLLVNKGYKNLGTNKTIQKLEGLNFALPIGVSIGRTNSQKLVTQKESITDIIQTFTKFEKSKVQHQYYELNISCPNLFGNINFYPAKNLKELLIEIEKLQIKRPIFVKMPIEKTNQETLQMLKIISQFNIQGVIFGNLQKDRKHPTLNPDEIKAAGKGNFSGKPTWSRSNELIKLAFRNYRKRFVIIGCGGVFSAEDAYYKIKLGASLVQLITGMIFQGPQLIAQINSELLKLLEKDGFNNIKEAVGII